MGGVWVPGSSSLAVVRPLLVGPGRLRVQTSSMGMSGETLASVKMEMPASIATRAQSSSSTQRWVLRGGQW